ncbi:MAG: hypothetical protein JSS19_15335 [Proteobacteria bacterium]|nr:hypothetical protein [Pseudomonadota bacterium]MBS0610706.1 hypothetical protein [Pseudomonadota bacterium]
MKQTLPFAMHSAVALLFASTAAFADALRRHAERYARRRLAQRTEQSIGALDAHVLRDLGLMHGEISSVASEIAGDAEATRRRIVLLHR